MPQDKCTVFMMALPLGGDFTNIPKDHRSIAEQCCAVIGEERSVAMKVLAELGMTSNVRTIHHDTDYTSTESSTSKGILNLYLLNEHSDKKYKMWLAKHIAKSHKNVLFFSDNGTPSIADPDFEFVDKCYKAKGEIIPLAGASSITAGLSVSGFDASSFTYLGFPPKQPHERKTFFKEIPDNTRTVVFMERPYSLDRVVNTDLSSIEKKLRLRRVCIVIDIDGENFQILRGSVSQVKKLYTKVKAPFVVIIECDNS